MVTHWAEYLFNVNFSAKWLARYGKLENWSERIDSGMPCVSMKVQKKLTEHFPLVDFVTFTDGSFENLSIATSKQICFRYGFLSAPHNLIVFPGRLRK